PKQKIQTFYKWGDNEQLSEFIVHDRDEPIYNTRKFSDPQNACLRPVITDKIIYKYSDNQFEPIKKETYSYEFMQKEEVWDMPIYMHTTVVYARYGPNGINSTDYYNTA